MGFPLEFKTKVLEAVAKGKMTQDSIAKKFGVSTASITAWNRLKAKTKGKKPATKKIVAKKKVIKASAKKLAKAH